MSQTRANPEPAGTHGASRHRAHAQAPRRDRGPRGCLPLLAGPSQHPGAPFPATARGGDGSGRPPQRAAPSSAWEAPGSQALLSSLFPQVSASTRSRVQASPMSPDSELESASQRHSGEGGPRPLPPSPEPGGSSVPPRERNGSCRRRARGLATLEGEAAASPRRGGVRGPSQGPHSRPRNQG